MNPVAASRAGDRGGTPRSAVGDWLLGTLLPYWLEHIVDPGGGFFEALDAGGAPVRAAPRTLLTQARLVYAWSHAHVLSGEPRYLAAARHGIAFLEQHCRDAAGGWHSPGSRVFDAYDHAFVLFALAWFARASGDAKYADHAESTWRFLERTLGDPRYGGFAECAPATSTARRQNPHMHLFEAALACFETTRAERWRLRADVLAALFLDRFIAPDNGSLVEHFGQDWSQAAGLAGTLREPGHHCEWVWLLAWHRRLGAGPRATELADAGERLWQFAMAHGVDTQGAAQPLLFDEINADGTLRTPTKLVWPQTECVKALVARSAGGDGRGLLQRAVAVQEAMLGAHFDGARTRWSNRIARDGTPLEATAPARILYHLVLSAAELDRALVREASAHG